MPTNAQQKNVCRQWAQCTADALQAAKGEWYAGISLDEKRLSILLAMADIWQSQRADWELVWQQPQNYQQLTPAMLASAGWHAFHLHDCDHKAETAIMLALYLQLIFSWRQDHSANLDPTMAMLDKRLRQLAQAQSWLQNIAR